MGDFTPQEVAALKALAAGILGASGGGGGNGGGQASGGVASDSECLGSHGDPSVRKDPKRWAGDTCVGLPYSQCPAEFLDCFAESAEYFANLDANKPDPPKHRNGTPWYVYNRKDAALARGWARRIRAGLVKQSTGVSASSGRQPSPPADAGGSDGFGGDYAGEGDDELPF